MMRYLIQVLAIGNFLRNVDFQTLIRVYPNLNLLDVRGNSHFNCSNTPPRRLRVKSDCERSVEAFNVVQQSTRAEERLVADFAVLNLLMASSVFALSVCFGGLLALFIQQSRNTQKHIGSCGRRVLNQPSQV